MLYQFSQPHAVDASAYTTTFGPGQVTPYAQGIARTVDWYSTTARQSFLGIGR